MKRSRTKPLQKQAHLLRSRARIHRSRRHGIESRHTSAQLGLALFEIGQINSNPNSTRHLVPAAGGRTREGCVEAPGRCPHSPCRASELYDTHAAYPAPSPRDRCVGTKNSQIRMHDHTSGTRCLKPEQQDCVEARGKNTIVAIWPADWAEFGHIGRRSTLAEFYRI